MKDPSVEAYVNAIERHLRSRRGSEHVLSPRDFALARAWHDAGVPLATVLAGIDRAFSSGEDVNSLAFCRRRVEERLGTGPLPLARPAPPPPTAPLAEVERLLAALLERLSSLSQACFEPPLRKVQEVRERLSSRPDWDELRTRLREIDDEVSAAALRALSPEELDLYRSEAARALDRHRGRVEEAALVEAVARHTIQRARGRFELPWVSEA